MKKKGKRQESTEYNLYGLRSCIAVWKYRPNDILKVFLLKKVEPLLKKELSWCSANRIGFNFVQEDDLEKLSKSTHHEGIVIKTSIPKGLPFQACFRNKQWSSRYLILDNVGNPHNIGALLRTAAHFGVDSVIGVSGRIPRLSPSAIRMAEGGAEVVPIVEAPSYGALKTALRENKISTIGLDPHQPIAIHDVSLQSATALVLGNEVSGMSDEGRGLCDRWVSIPGSGSVESLNVSAAGAIALYALRPRR